MSKYINNAGKSFDLSPETSKLIEQEIAEQSGAWEPKYDEQYWYVDGGGNTNRTIWLNDASDKSRYAMGNVFRIKEKAEAHRDWLKAVATIRRSTSFVPSWKDNNQEKYGVYYSYSMGKLGIGVEVEHKFSIVYYATKEEAQAAIDNPEINAAYKTYLGVK